jgi:hypothetical protein
MNDLSESYVYDGHFSGEEPFALWQILDCTSNAVQSDTIATDRSPHSRVKDQTLEFSG